MVGLLQVQLKPQLTFPGVWALCGSTNYGDSIADEWLIVYILQELSKQHFDLWIRVYDTDGEFLLIEAANVLPKWIKPEMAENRVGLALPCIIMLSGPFLMWYRFGYTGVS
jgi:hypothetical protein